MNILFYGTKKYDEEFFDAIFAGVSRAFDSLSGGKFVTRDSGISSRLRGDLCIC